MLMLVLKTMGMVGWALCKGRQGALGVLTDGHAAVISTPGQHTAAGGKVPKGGLRRQHRAQRLAAQPRAGFLTALGRRGVSTAGYGCGSGGARAV